MRSLALSLLALCLTAAAVAICPSRSEAQGAAAKAPVTPAAPPKGDEIAGGFDRPEKYHEIDHQVIAGAFDKCFDPGFIYPCCRCNDGIWPMTEYWWPVAKVENVDVPHRTGYVKKADVSRGREAVERLHGTGGERDWLKSVGKRNPLLNQRPSGVPGLAALRATPTLTPTIAQKRASAFQRQEGINYTEYHTFSEPFGRSLDGLYWSKSMYGRLACHWNLPEQPVEQALMSDLPTGFETSRKAADQNLVMAGKDYLRPGIGYDQDGSFNNGGYISEYIALSASEKMECMQAALSDDNTAVVAGDGGGDTVRERCLRKNPGGWVPTSNRVKSPSSQIASSVGTLRGIKLAYYYFPPDSFCKGRGLLDSAGYCYNPMIHGGHFYDFEPHPYAAAYAEHDAFWQNGLSKQRGQERLVADKVQWTQSEPEGMPKECIALMRTFNVAEKQAASFGRHNVAVQWRFFRTCPKEVFGADKSYGQIAGSNTAVCCERCECPGKCCCPADKKL